MKWTGLNEVREKFLSFFESKGHKRLESFPLIPQGDKSLLLINAGMAPFKDYFRGVKKPPAPRVTTCQKCIRTPDIERVGKTARHGTYFEMLGNFSFGDYFKHEATKWAYEFSTKIMGLPEDKIYISIYEEDDEAFSIWTKEVSIPAEKIVRMGKEDNFWELSSGPCGPCSELYFDRGEQFGCGSDDCKVGCECDRFVEYWNLVFTQFDSDGLGTYTPLAKPNIDTGMGLERLACIIQGVDNIFEIDTIKNIMNAVCSIANVEYKKDPKVDVSLRIITDHIRSTTFMLSDGVISSNEGRGYVLRRLLRRAARHGRLLGINEPFLYKIVSAVVKENECVYTDLIDKQSMIENAIKREEESFAKTIDKGFEMLTSIIDSIDISDIGGEEKILSAEDAFKLYDTFGFPIDLTKEIIAEKNITVDEAAFFDLMNEQRKRARAARLLNNNNAWSEDSLNIDVEKTKFVGYDYFTVDSKIILLANETEQISTASMDDDVTIITEKTPFYATGGGQVCDVGYITNEDESAVVKIFDVQKGAKDHYFHSGKVVKGTINLNDTVTLSVDKEYRLAVMRNHTAAHLLQKALINKLGDHVHQAGQLVDNKRLRFDFSHYEAIKKEDLAQIENEINSVILKGIPVSTYETDIESAKKNKVTALFGEKYADKVRVVDIKPYSAELCGGTHVSNTSKIGLIKIISESSVASGVRRIEAVTGTNVIDVLNDTISIVTKASNELKLPNPSALNTKITSLLGDLKEANRQNDILSTKLANSVVHGLFENMSSCNGVNYFTAMLSATKPDALKSLGDTIKDKAPNAVALIVGSFENKYTMLCVCGKDAVAKGAHAGKIVSKASAITGGKGGGSADRALAGIVDAHKVDDALLCLKDILEEIIK